MARIDTSWIMWISYSKSCLVALYTSRDTLKYHDHFVHISILLFPPSIDFWLHTLFDWFLFYKHIIKAYDFLFVFLTSIRHEFDVLFDQSFLFMIFCLFILIKDSRKVSNLLIFIYNFFVYHYRNLNSTLLEPELFWIYDIVQDFDQSFWYSIYEIIHTSGVYLRYGLIIQSFFICDCFFVSHCLFWSTTQIKYQTF